MVFFVIFRELGYGFLILVYLFVCFGLRFRFLRERFVDLGDLGYLLYFLVLVDVFVLGIWKVGMVEGLSGMFNLV